MNANRFDRLTRSLSVPASRRQALATLATGALGLGIPGLAGARKGKSNKNKTRKSPFNAFGCLNIRAKCRGKNDLCCSGICGGKKPKKGEKDKRRCVAHDTGGCRADLGACGEPAVACVTSGGGPGICHPTTGNAGYCLTDNFASCGKCSKDADCRADFGPNAACIVCPSCSDDTACVGFDVL